MRSVCAQVSLQSILQMSELKDWLSIFTTIFMEKMPLA